MTTSTSCLAPLCFKETNIFIQNLLHPGIITVKQNIRQN
jgi:hypothetical protein